MMNPSESKKGHLDLATMRALLAAGGREYWRTLENLVTTKDFDEFLHRMLPRQMAAFGPGVTRRDLLKLAGVALAMAALPGCTRTPDEEILPYVHPPDDLMSGRPLFYSTAMTLNGSALGLLVESHEGRPTKIEGNPRHPASVGATDAFAQASVYALYDPDRSRAVLNEGKASTWAAFLRALRSRMTALRDRKGAGLRILTETVTSPTLTQQLRGLLADFPAAKWHRFDPVGTDNVKAGAQMAFGEYVDARYQFDRADVVLSLDADFLAWPPGHVRYARDFTARRQVRAGTKTMNRLYVVEATPTITGAMADHRLALRPTQIEAFARALAQALGKKASGEAPPLPPEHVRVFSALTRDLRAHPGSSLIVAGPQQPPAVHALVHGMNQIQGNAGTTVIYTDAIETDPVDHLGSFRSLVEDMAAGFVEVLVIVGGNPVYTAPVDLQFRERLAKVPFSVHLSLYDDETSTLCTWHIPSAHELEAWSDARAYDGTATIIQPLIAPLYGGKTAHELLAALVGQPSRSSYDIVRGYWRSRQRTGDFDPFWRAALHAGLIVGTALPPKRVSLRADFAASVSKGRPAQTGSSGETLEIVFRPDPTIWDGRFANNAWLQELPKPLTTLTWDNALLVAPQTAERLDLHNEDVVDIEYRGRSVRGPVLILSGHAAEAVTLTLGYGRTRAGHIADGLGVNAYALRRSDALWFDSGVKIRKTGEQYRLAITQGHHRMEGRDLVQVATIRQFRDRLHVVHGSVTEEQSLPSLYPGFSYKEGYAWGMAIDLNACIGCNACVLACQAENNVPTVGKTQVLSGREMHWLRVDRYDVGDVDQPRTYFEPVLCMHCENAPCEVVCPVGATSHSAEGLNQMTYNRCVGTRYCSNNCPYKVRRFNFFQFADVTTPSLQLMHNPDVTVRARGVMEKCSYCVQRIQKGKIGSEEENRRVRDGEIKTACQQACPAEAIVFGDLNDPTSRVAKLRAQPHSYALLAELNTQPRTTYLTKIRNPNPEIEPA